MTLTAWSPDERNLFAATPSSLFRLGHGQCQGEVKNETTVLLLLHVLIHFSVTDRNSLN